MKTTKEALQEAEEKLKREKGDSESYHGVFDALLEERLMELDPEYITKMRELYETSGESRWYA